MSDDTWKIHKAPHVAEALAANLARLRVEDAVRPDEATGLAEYERGGMEAAIILGSGHTLPGDLRDAIARTDPRGATFAVNSSLAACLSRGVVPDYVVCRESIDMSSCFAPLETMAEENRRAHEAKALDPEDGTDWPRHAFGYAVPHRLPTPLLDVQSSPLTFAACERLGLHPRWFVPASMQTFALAHALSVRPVYAGTTSVTGAIALAVFMGFREIHLMGCTRAFSRDGKAYADGAQWDSVRLAGVDVVEDPRGRHYVATITGRERQAKLHAASGQREPLKRERVVPLTRLDGSTAWATEGLAEGKLWMETFAARHPHVRFVQHGAADDVPLVGFEGGLPAKATPHAPDRMALARAETRRGTEFVRDLSETLLSGASVCDLPAFADFSTTALHYVGKRGQVAREAGKDPRKVIPAACHVMAESAEKIAGLVSPEGDR